MTRFEDEIQKNGYIVYTNIGDSMMPLLRQKKDLMVIKKITSPLKKNDAVLFKRPNGAYVLHRIIKLCGDGTYKIVGDNRCFAETVPKDWIIGILTEVIKDGKPISFESKEYKSYLKKLPKRRFLLKCQAYREILFRKLRKVLRRNKQ